MEFKGSMRFIKLQRRGIEDTKKASGVYAIACRVYDYLSGHMLATFTLPYS